jgi:hypothetical protein
MGLKFYEITGNQLNVSDNCGAVKELGQDPF